MRMNEEADAQVSDFWQLTGDEKNESQSNYPVQRMVEVKKEGNTAGKSLFIISRLKFSSGVLKGHPSPSPSPSKSQNPDVHVRI